MPYLLLYNTTIYNKNRSMGSELIWPNIRICVQINHMLIEIQVLCKGECYIKTIIWAYKL